jgi:hypothetical protein
VYPFCLCQEQLAIARGPATASYRRVGGVIPAPLLTDLDRHEWGTPHEVPGGPCGTHSCKTLPGRSLALSLSCEQRNPHHRSPEYHKEEWYKIAGPRCVGQ